MSMTLILLKAPVDPADAQRLLGPWYEHGDDSAFAPSDDIARTADMLRSRWPDDYDDEPPENCRWADMPFEQSSRLLALHVRWGADDEAIAAITVIARKLGLVLYDPQGPDVFLPDDPLDPGPVTPPTPIRVVQGRSARRIPLRSDLWSVVGPGLVVALAGGDRRRLPRRRRIVRPCSHDRECARHG